ncbi:MAG: lysophospholipid acyltransferase family protein [Candidatus Saccharimonas sp.]
MKILGRDNIPKEGSALIVANHGSTVDSLGISAFAGRQVVFLAKKEYFEGHHPMRIFVGGGSGIPVDRSNKNSGVRALGKCIEILKTNSRKIIGIHTEGTRTPKNKVYRGSPGAIHIAKRSKALIIPTSIKGAEDANPPGKLWPKFRAQIIITFGKPVDVSKGVDECIKEILGYVGVSETAAQNLLDSEGLGGIPLEKGPVRLMRAIMRYIAWMGDMEYIDKEPVRAVDLAKKK